MAKLNPVIEYFGLETVERTVASFFAKHGVSEQIRDYLMSLEEERLTEFLDLVCEFVEGGMEDVSGPPEK